MSTGASLRLREANDETVVVTMQRSDLSPATRIMVPMYAVFFAWIGLSGVATPLHRLLLTPALAHTQTVIDVRVWGMVFLAVSAGLCFAMIWPRSSRARPTATYALLFGAVVMALWTVFLVWSSVSGEASPGAGAYSALPSVACYATYRSVLWRQ